MCVLGGNKIHGLEGRQTQEGRLSLSQLDRDDSNRPDIDELVIVLLFNEFGSHPGRSTYN